MFSTHIARLLRPKFILIALTIAGSVLLSWQLVAQQSKDASIFEIMHAAKDGDWQKGETTHIAGDSSLQRMDIRQQNTRVSRVRFAPGARTNWHSHVGGQVLYVESGHGLVQRWGGEIQEVGPGDVVYTAPGEKHWHGATPGSEVTQVAVSIGDTEWKEMVTDEQYRAKH